MLLSLIDGVFIWLIELPLQFILIKFTTLEISIIYAVVLFLELFKILIGYIFIRKNLWLNNLISK